MGTKMAASCSHGSEPPGESQPMLSGIQDRDREGQGEVGQGGEELLWTQDGNEEEN